MARITILAEEPTGPYADKLKTLPLPQPSLGVDGVGNRWVARNLAQATGGLVTPWVASNGTALTANSGTNAPVLTTSLGLKALSFDGVDDALRLPTLPVAQRTMILLARITAADGVAVSILGAGDDDIQLIRNAQNNLGVFAPGTGVAAAGSETGSAWRAFGLRLSATEATVWRDGVKITTAASTGGAMPGVRLPVGGGQFGKIDVAEFITYPTALTDAQMMTVYLSLKDQYGLATA